MHGIGFASFINVGKGPQASFMIYACLDLLRQAYKSNYLAESSPRQFLSSSNVPQGSHAQTYAIFPSLFDCSQKKEVNAASK
eukprot:711001-Pelagomonas_calceolata.AAC.4